MQNILLIGFLAEAFRCHMHVATEPPSIENGTHGVEKLLLKTKVSEDFA